MATHRYRAVSPASLDCRQAERLFVAVRRVVVDLDEDGAEAVLCDVSRFGCRMETAARYAMGEAVMLRIGGGMEVAACVVWSAAGVVGCRFDRPMPPATMRALTIRG